MLLSIIVPFFNSIGKCQRLLDTLSAIEDAAIELVFVDDGSTDGTAEMLQAFSSRSRLPLRVISQENKGPGAARNAGLEVAVGEYIWFVDSDDDIDPSVLVELRHLAAEGFDFIDFDYVTGGEKISSMCFSPGAYADVSRVRRELIKNFGRLCTKIFRSGFLLRHDIRYPEFCIYEDNPLTFVLPLLVGGFYKSDLVGYYHHENFSSVTRSEIGLRYFDRLKTAEHGLFLGSRILQSSALVEFGEKFLRLYLINTVRKLTARGRGRYWYIAMRVMRQYRCVAEAYDLRLNPLKYLRGSLRRRMIFLLLWCGSYGLPEQSNYFSELHRKAWGRL